MDNYVNMGYKAKIVKAKINFQFHTLLQIIGHWLDYINSRVSLIQSMKTVIPFARILPECFYIRIQVLLPTAEFFRYPVSIGRANMLSHEKRKEIGNHPGKNR